MCNVSVKCKGVDMLHISILYKVQIKFPLKNFDGFYVCKGVDMLHMSIFREIFSIHIFYRTISVKYKGVDSTYQFYINFN